jgi:tRNA A-37 threonylcarbamoyl transferase component Bud32
MNAPHPPDDELLAAATGDAASAGIEAHMANCADCQMRLKLLRGEIAELRSLSGRHVETAAKTVVPGSSGPSLKGGSAIGRYLVVGDVGSGGQADVYHVIDPDLRRDLVLKLSRREAVEGDQHRDALLAEGRMLAALDHPGLVRIFDVGILNGRPYLVLDLVKGRNLEQIFADKRPSAREAARLIAEVAQVVAYAHQRGVVHGDITPRNILIDAHGRARLIDFGLSQIADAWGESGGPPGGTPEFIAPEVIPDGGRSRRVAPAGDVFGLGATLFWLLTGRPPFAAPTGALALERARRGDIDFDALDRARVPARLGRLCRQALAADPADRPAADILAIALERASRRWMSRRLAAAVVVMALAGGLVWGLPELWESGSVKEVSVVQSAPAIHVFRHDRIHNLSNVLPLRTGDRVEISCHIEPGHRAVMLWFNAAGELKSFTPVRDVDGKVDRLIYPGPNRAAVLDPPEGTEMIFFCRGDPVDLEQLQTSFPMGTPPPALPAQNWLELRRDKVEPLGPLEAASDELVGEIERAEELMKEINRNLLVHFKGVTGIAFPHRAAGEHVESMK